MSELRNKILGLIHAGETLRVEFKEKLSGKQEKGICKEIAAIATIGGGYLLIGVSDSGEIKGVSEPSRINDKIMAWVNNHVKPIPTVITSVLEIDKKLISVLKIDNNGSPYYSYEGKPYHRVGTLSEIMSVEQVAFAVKNTTTEKSLQDIFSDLNYTKAMVASIRYSVAPAIIGQGDLATTNYNQVRDKVINDLISTHHFSSITTKLTYIEAITMQHIARPAISILNQGDLATRNYLDLKRQLFSEVGESTYIINMNAQIHSYFSVSQNKIFEMQNDIRVKDARIGHLEGKINEIMARLLVSESNYLTLSARISILENKLKMLAS